MHGYIKVGPWIVQGKTGSSGVFQLVINISERLIAADPTGNIGKRKGIILHYEGEPLNFLGDNEKSLIAFDKATSVSPENPHSWNGKGRSLFALGKIQEADRFCIMIERSKLNI